MQASKWLRISDEDLVSRIIDASNHASSFEDSDRESFNDEAYLLNATALDSDNDAEDVQNGKQWSLNGRRRIRLPFTINSGIKVEIKNPLDPLEVFEIFFNDDLINTIVTETNRYSSQFLEENFSQLKARSLSKEWVETDHDEIRVFLALILLQGVCHKPELQQYFSKRASLLSPFFGKVIEKDRFLLLSKFLHFANNKDFSPNSNIPKKLYNCGLY